MKTFRAGPLLRLAPSIALMALQAPAQSGDPMASASGWARTDKDGSIALYDPGRGKIISWARDGGTLGEVDVSMLPRRPEMWVIDASFNAWVIAGRTFHFVGRDGNMFITKLPFVVGDLAWDAKGIYISYRCEEPYLEKRGYDDGRVLWTFRGDKKEPTPSSNVRYRIEITADDALLVTHAGSFQMDRIESASGRFKDTITFTFMGKPAPPLALGGRDQGPMLWCLDKNLAIQAVPASQVPSLGLTGLILVKKDVSTASLEYLATTLSEQARFIGTVDSDAAFIAPGGGLVFMPIR